MIPPAQAVENRRISEKKVWNERTQGSPDGHDCVCGSDAGIGYETTDEGEKILVRDDDAGGGRDRAVCVMNKPGSLPLETRELPRIIVTGK